MNLGKMEAMTREPGMEDLAARFEKFFRTNYIKEIHKVIHCYPAKKSLWVDFEDLDRYDISLADEVISNPDNALPAAERALRSIDLPVDLPSIRINVRFHNLPAVHKIMIKDIRSEHVGKFMAVEGIVRKATDVRPKLTLGVFECQKCGGITRISQDTQKLKEPFICEDCEGRGPFKLLVHESTFVDSQKILIQESLEDLHGGEHPKQLSVYLEDDLTGEVTPGDRVELVGTLRAVRKLARDKRSRVFEIYLEANSYKPIELDFEEVKITPEDEKRIIELSKDPHIYEKIRDSIAPHIYGYTDIKEAIMYQLFSSPALELPDGGRIRGDSHIIIMGEPATGKCVSGDTRIWLANGELIKIKELVDPILEKNPVITEDGRSWSKLKKPVYVLSMNDSLKIEKQRITHVWRRRYVGKILRVATQSGRNIRVTPEHPFFVIRNGLVTSIPAEELTPGIRIATPGVIPVPGEPQDLHKNAASKTLPEKKLPNFVFRCTKEEISNLLRAFFDGKGHVSNKQSQSRIHACSSSRVLLEQIQYLLLRFGILSALKPVWKCATNKRKRYRLAIQGYENLKKYAENIGFLTPEKKKRLLECLNASRSFPLAEPVLGDGGKPRPEDTPSERFAFSDVFWDKVERIEAEYIDDYVYDLTIEDRHNFIADGIIVHNSEILQYVAKVLAPRGVYASGKGTSAAGLCAAPSSLVCLENGVLLPLGDVVERELEKGRREYRRGVWLAENPGLGSSAFALNGREELEPKKILQYWKLRAPRRVVKITTKTGREIEVTPETPLFSASRGRFEWKKAKLLKPGDFLASARAFRTRKGKVPLCIDLIESDPIVYGCEDVVKKAAPSPGAGGKPRLSRVLELASAAGIPREEVAEGIKSYSQCHGPRITLPVRLNRDFLYLAGLIAGNGDLRETPRGGCSIRFSSSSQEMLEKFRTLTRRLFSVDVRVDAGSKLRPPSARLYSKLVGEILLRLGIPFSPNSKIDLSPELLGLPDELLACYISGLFDCDGRVVKRRDGRSYIEFVTTSGNLARKLHLSLLRFGVISELKKHPGIEQKTEFCVGQRESKHYHIYIRGKSNLLAFKEGIGFRHEGKRKALDEAVAGSLKDYDPVPFAGAIMREIREALALSSRETGYRSYSPEGGFSKPSRGFVKNFIQRVEKLKKGYKDRVYLEVEESLKKKLYRRARAHLSRRELSKLLGKKESALDEYFLRKSRKVRIPYSTLESLCSFLEEKGYKDCSFREIGKKVDPSIDKVKQRILKAEEKLRELRASLNVLWDEIVDVEWKKPDYRYVYDLTIQDAHNFLVNGIVSHNTAAAIKDEFGDGGWSLEAGALVLADKGIACLSPGSKVILNNQILKIEDAFDENRTFRGISGDEEVEISAKKYLTVSIDNLRSVESRSTLVRRKKYGGKLLEIHLASGFRIKLTPEHMLIDGNTLKWKRAEEFRAGDYVVAPLKLPENREDIYLLDILPASWIAILDKEQEELKGIVLSKYRTLEEFNRKYGVSKNFLSGNGQIKVGVLRKALKELGVYEQWRKKELAFGRKAPGEKLRISKVTPELAYFIGFVYRDPGAWGENTVPYSPNLLAFLCEYFTADGLRKLLRLPDECLKAFVAGCLDSDGCISMERRGYEAVRVEFRLTDDEESALAFILALRRFDCYARLAKEKSVFKILITGRKDVEALVEAVRNYSQKARRVPRRKQSSSPEVKQEIRVPPLRDYFLDKIEEIRWKDYFGYVYDLYVPGYHNFLCDGIIVHNCIDEFDKMQADDRGAMHEAMEQQSYHRDVEIRLANGEKVKIGEFVEELMEKNKDKVIHTENGSKLLVDSLNLRINTSSFRENFPARIFSVSKHRAPEKFVRLFFENGRSITVTPEHPVFVFENGRIGTKEAGEIREGDCSLAALGVTYRSDNTSLPSPGVKRGGKLRLPRRMDLSLARVIGFLITDGGIEMNQGRPMGIMFVNKDEELVRTFNSDIKTLFGLEPYVYRRDGVIYSRVISEDVCGFFKNLDGKAVKEGEEKALPELVFGMEGKYKRELLRAIFECDGHVEEDGSSIELGSESRILLEQVQELLLEFGVYSYLKDFNASSKLFITGNDQLLRFSGEIGFMSSNKNSRLKKVLAEGKIPNLEEAVSPSIRFLKVVKKEVIKNQDQEWVYDVQVEPTHNFISQGLILHNSVSIAKAGILATFRARCSILAAANPKFGRFDDYRSISEQINLPPTILSRFDLIFFVRDVLEETREVARHILNTVVSPREILPKIEPELLRKYIAYARQKVTPTLTEEARDRIEQFYVEMRDLARSAEDMPIPLTARQLWAILRIARAASRVRLSNETTLEDVERAIRLVKVSLRQAGFDLETGRVDIDKIMVGVTKSQRDRITRILEIIREIEKEYGSAKKSEILERAAEEGIPEREAERAIEKLRADGHIYDPRRDERYKVV